MPGQSEAKRERAREIEGFNAEVMRREKRKQKSGGKAGRLTLLHKTILTSSTLEITHLSKTENIN